MLADTAIDSTDTRQVTLYLAAPIPKNNCSGLFSPIHKTKSYFNRNRQAAIIGQDVKKSTPQGNGVVLHTTKTGSTPREFAKKLGLLLYQKFSPNILKDILEEAAQKIKCQDFAVLFTHTRQIGQIIKTVTGNDLACENGDVIAMRFDVALNKQHEQSVADQEEAIRLRKKARKFLTKLAKATFSNTRLKHLSKHKEDFADEMANSLLNSKKKEKKVDPEALKMAKLYKQDIPKIEGEGYLSRALNAAAQGTLEGENINVTIEVISGSTPKNNPERLLG